MARHDGAVVITTFKDVVSGVLGLMQDVVAQRATARHKTIENYINARGVQ
jgi:hypothetical protein